MEDIVSFETALTLKEKGFDWPARKGYRENKELDSFAFNESRTNDSLNRDKLDHKDFISVAPSLYAAAKWLRELHKIDVALYSTASGYDYTIDKAYYTNNISGGTQITNGNYGGNNRAGRWEVYEEALEAGINKALTLI